MEIACNIATFSLLAFFSLSHFEAIMHALFLPISTSLSIFPVVNPIECNASLFAWHFGVGF